MRTDVFINISDYLTHGKKLVKQAQIDNIRTLSANIQFMCTSLKKQEEKRASDSIYLHKSLAFKKETSSTKKKTLYALSTRKHK